MRAERQEPVRLRRTGSEHARVQLLDSMFGVDDQPKFRASNTQTQVVLALTRRGVVT